MSEFIGGECCDGCGESGHMLADPTLFYIDGKTFCGECYEEWRAHFEPAALFERLAEAVTER